jgi:purine-nucleoside phosphorylase
MDELRAAALEIGRRASIRPRVAVVCRKEFGVGAELLDWSDEVPLGKLPGEWRDQGGTIRIGSCEEVPVAVLERHDVGWLGTTTLLRIAHLLGVETCLLGGVGVGLGSAPSESDLFLVADHLNLTGGNPLVGDNWDDFGPRFPDMSEAYDPALRELASRAAERLRVRLREGVFAEVSHENWARDFAVGTPGPEEEIALFGRAGAEMVGIGLVPEVIVARHMGARVLALARDLKGESFGASIAPLIREIVKEL